MSDPFQKKQPGDPVMFSAGFHNANVDAVKAYLASLHTRKSQDTGAFRQADIVRIRNDTGNDLLRRSVLALDGPIFGPEEALDSFLQEVTFAGVTPTSAKAGRFCVLLEPCLAGSIAKAWVSGVCQVKVDIVNEDDTCADLLDGETGHLISGSGPAQILWKESEGGGYYGYAYGYDTGVMWCIVLLGPGCGGGSRWVRVTGGDIDPGDFGTVTLYDNPEDENLTATTLSVRNQFTSTTIPDETDIWIHQHNGKWGFGVWECPGGGYY